MALRADWLLHDAQTSEDHVRLPSHVLTARYNTQLPVIALPSVSHQNLTTTEEAAQAQPHAELEIECAANQKP